MSRNNRPTCQTLNVKLGAELLEDRLNPTDFFVNNPFDVHKPGNDPATTKPWRNLRECIDLANQTANVLGLEDTIYWEPVAFDANNDCITILGSPLPTISEAVDLWGTVQGKNKPQVKSPGGFRVFDIVMPPPRGGQKVSFVNLVISGGNAIESVTPPDPYTGNGGGIRSLDAELDMKETVVTNNTASGDGGGVFAVGYGRQVHLRGKTALVAANTAGSNGGGIATQNCQLVLDEGVQVLSNTAGKNGGGIAVFAHNFALPVGGAPVILSIDGTLDEDHTVRIQGNVATNGDGGGVYVANLAGAPPTAQLAGVTINNNRADGPVGGLASGRGGGIAAFGGLVLNGDDSVLVSGNAQRTDAGVLGAYLAPGVGGTFATDAVIFGNFLIQGGPLPPP